MGLIKYDDFIKYLKKIPKVLGVAITGGAGKGYRDKDSDIDLMVLVKGIKFEGFIKKYISGLDLEFHPVEGFMDNLHICAFKTSDYRVDLKIIDINDFKKIVDKQSGEMFAAFVKDINILYDPKGILKEGKKTPILIDFHNQVYNLIVYLLDIEHKIEVCVKRDDFIHLTNLFSQAIVNSIKIVYALNNKPYQSTKWAFKDIEKMGIKPNNFEKRLRTVINLGNSPDEIWQKIDLLKNIGNDLYYLIQKKYPDIINVKTHIEWLK